jgi:RecB family endonuclease NucS
MPMTEPDPRRVEEQIAHVLHSAPEGSVVSRNARMGDIETDFLVETPDNRIFVIEVKSGLSASRIGSAAQLARYRDVFSDARGKQVIPILVAVGSGAVELREAAADFGIEILAGETVEQIAEALIHRLSA